jgi:purine-binding chemotaxis protein CheW
MTLSLIFTLGEMFYGLEIEMIQEIIEDPVLHHVPRAKGVLKGAINFHGQILALVDLPKLLGLAGAKRDLRRLVLTPAGKSLVLTVSSIQRIVPLDLANMQEPPESCEKSAIRGVVDLDETTVNLLDTNAILKQLENLYAE